MGCGGGGGCHNATLRLTIFVGRYLTDHCGIQWTGGLVLYVAVTVALGQAMLLVNLGDFFFFPFLQLHCVEWLVLCKALQIFLGIFANNLAEVFGNKYVLWNCCFGDDAFTLVGVPFR